jgi:hypothetical protein
MSAMKPRTIHPMPSPPRRTIMRWTLLAIHVAPFACVIFAYTSFSDSAPNIFNNNVTRLGIPMWGLLVVVHLILTAVFDLREGIVYGRKERRRVRDYERLKKRQHMMERVVVDPEMFNSPDIEIVDEDTLGY